jgi:hypothetical protein
MTESDWLAATDPQMMLEFLRTQGTLSPRKARLYAAACCRRSWHLLTDEGSREAVEVAERYADGEADADAMSEANTAAWMVHLGYVFGGIDFTPGRQVVREAAKRQRVGRAVSEAVLAAAWWESDEEWRLGRDGVAVSEPAEAVSTALFFAATHGEDSGVSNTGGRWHHPALCHVVRDIFGNPFEARPRIDPAWLAWNGGTIPKLAEASYQERSLPSGELDNARLGVLADALEEAGADALLLEHLRSPGPHVRGCFAIDLLTGRE